MLYSGFFISGNKSTGSCRLVFGFLSHHMHRLCDIYHNSGPIRTPGAARRRPGLTEYRNPLEWIYRPITTGCVSAFTSGSQNSLPDTYKGWFAYRLYKFSKSCYLPLFCVFLSASRTIGSVALATFALRRMPVLTFVEAWGWLIVALLVIGVATDLILVVSLCYQLSTWRGEGFIR